jgi:hypothetical protein
VVSAGGRIAGAGSTFCIVLGTLAAVCVLSVSVAKL